MARPTKLNFNTHNKIITAIRAGNYIETAAAYAGVNKSTLYEWLKRWIEELEKTINFLYEELNKLEWNNSL